MLLQIYYDIYDIEDLLKIIAKYHNDKDHRGIEKIFLELKDKIYYTIVEKLGERFFVLGKPGSIIADS